MFLSRLNNSRQTGSPLFTGEPTEFVPPMDVIVVATGNRSHEEFWQKRLSLLRGTVCRPDALIVAVTVGPHEIRTGGPTSLVAYKKAQEKAKFMYRADLFNLQKRGASVAVYIASRRGRSLYPLVAAAGGNIGAITSLSFMGNKQLSHLEALIAQTQTLSATRKGRLSCFSVGQVIIPMKNFIDPVDHPIEVLTAEADKENIPLNLETFSLSPEATFALMRTLNPERLTPPLHPVCGKRFWVPLVLDKETYQQAMKGLAVGQKEAARCHDLMTAFREKFLRLHPASQLIRITNPGASLFWQDCSSTAKYYAQVLKLADPGPEGQAMRLLFQVDEKITRSNSLRVITDERSCLINCSIGAGRIVNSVLIGVVADNIDVQDCVIVNSAFTSLSANGTLLYNMQERQKLRLSPGTVRADALVPGIEEPLKLYSHLSRDGYIDWNTCLPQNDMSFKEVQERLRGEESVGKGK